MTENLSSFAAGRALLSFLQQQQQGLPSEVVQRITQLTAELVEEALLKGRDGSGGGAAKQGKGHHHQQQQLPQLQQQQPAAAAPSAPPPPRDLQSAEAVLQGVSFVSPRGKFDAGVFSDCLHISNKQTCADIPWASIQHVLIIDAIPKAPSTTYVVLVMKSGQPVRQGKNLLDLVVVQTKDAPELSLPAPAACQHLGPTLQGAAAVVLSQLLASYIEDVDEATFLTADARVFSSAAGDLMVAANKGVNPGWLVPLSAGLCYVGKAGCFMPRGRISRLTFHRTGGGSATFDVTIRLAGGDGGAAAVAGTTLELGQIDAAELPKLQAYCADQRIRIGGDDDEEEEAEDEGAAPATGAAGGAAAGAGAASDDDDDDDDEDFSPTAKRRRTGGEGGAAAAADDGGSSQDDGGSSSEAEGSEEDSDDDGSDDDLDLVPSDELAAMDEEDEADWGE